MKKRVLLSAFACHPNSGSEPYVGWSWMSNLKDDVDLYVITRKYSKGMIGSQAPDNVKFIYCDFTRFENKDHKWKYIKPYYIFWQVLAYFKILKLQRELKFQIIHHVTYNNIDVPGFFWLIPGVRFFWGAVGGGQIPPYKLRRILTKKTFLKSTLRDMLKLSSKINPFICLAVYKSTHVFYANQETESLTNHLEHSKSRMLETAIYSKDLISTLELNRTINLKLQNVNSRIINIIWVGRIVETKGLQIALDCLKHLPNHKLTVIGSGPHLTVMKDYATQNGIGHLIEFMGQIPFSEIKEQVRSADFFLFTSIQDTSGNVVLESQSQGVPVVAFNHQGVKEIVGGKGGVLVDYYNYESAIRNLVSACLEITASSDYYRSISLEARQNIVDNHTWSERRRNVVEKYNSIECNDA